MEENPIFRKKNRYLADFAPGNPKDFSKICQRVAVAGKGFPRPPDCQKFFFDSLKALTKSTLCQTLKNLARQGSKLAVKGVYTDANDRRLQVRLTKQAKIPPDFLLSEGIFAFAGFVSSLSALQAKLKGAFFTIIRLHPALPPWANTKSML